MARAQDSRKVLLTGHETAGRAPEEQGTEALKAVTQESVRTARGLTARRKGDGKSAQPSSGPFTIQQGDDKRPTEAPGKTSARTSPGSSEGDSAAGHSALHTPGARPGAALWGPWGRVKNPEPWVGDAEEEVLGRAVTPWGLAKP